MKGACRVEIVFEGKGSGGDLHGEEEEEEEERGLLQDLNSRWRKKRGEDENSLDPQQKLSNKKQHTPPLGASKYNQKVLSHHSIRAV